MSGVNIGTLTGEIQIIDNSAGPLAAVGANVSQIGSRFETLSPKTQAVSSSLSALGSTAATTGSKIASSATPAVTALGTAAGSTSGKLSSLSSGLGLIGSVAAGGAALSIIHSLAENLIDLGAAAFKNADALVKMSDKTGIGVESLQKLQAVGDASGNTIEQISGAVNRLQKGLGEGSKNTITALDGLGLSLGSLRAMKPEDQFATVAAAIAKVPDPMKQAQLAMELLGRSGAEILPTLKADIQGISAATTVMSAETVKNLDDMGDAWAAFKRNVTATAGNVFGFILEQNREANREAERTIERLRDINHLLEMTPKAPAGPAALIAPALPVMGLPSTEMMDYLDSQFKRLKQSSAEAMAPINAFNSALKTLQGQLSGSDLLAKAQQYEIAVKNIGGSSHLTSKELADTAGAYTAVIEKYAQLGPAGEKTVAHFQTLLTALGPLPEKADAFSKAVENLRAKLSGSDLLAKGKEFEVVMGQIGTTTGLTNKELADVIGTYLSIIDKYQRLGPAGASTVAHFRDLLSAVTPLPPVITEAGDALEGLGTRVDLEMPLLNMRALTDSVDQLQRQGYFAEAAFKKMGTTIGTLPNVKPSVDIDEWRNSAVTAGSTFLGSLEGVLQKIPQTFRSAFTGGGGIMGALKSILIDLGEAIGTLIAQRIAGAVSGSVATGAAGAAGGSSTGPAISGGDIAAGVATAGISLGVMGAIALYKHIHDAEWEKLGHDVGRDFGTALSEQVLRAMEADSKQFGRQATELLHLGDIIGGAGGLSTTNLDTFTHHLRDVFSLYQTGSLSASQAVEVLDKNWQAFVDAGTDADGRLSAGLKEVIQLTTATGLKSKEIADYMVGQGSAAITGFAAVVKGAALTSQQSLSDMGIQAVASITAAVAAGMSMPQALQAAGPALQALTDAYTNLGLDIDNAALRSLLFQSSILSANPDLIAAVNGLGAEMIALDNLGLMNVDTFGAMERTGKDMYTRLQAAAAAAGGSTRDALVPMQDWLHKAADEAKLLGVPLDDNTQMLIDQSTELGIWKDKGKDATSKLTDGMQTLVDKVSALIDRLGDIPDIDFNINGHYNAPTLPSAEPPGFATGTHGRLVDFGPRGTLVTLHNEERVQTKAEVMAGRANVFDMVPLLAEQRRTSEEMRSLKEYFKTTFGPQLARSVRDENQKAVRR